jgi:hypothetical protein
MESGHGDAAVVLIEAGTDRERVSSTGSHRSDRADDDSQIWMDRCPRRLTVLAERSRSASGRMLSQELDREMDKRESQLESLQQCEDDMGYVCMYQGILPTDETDVIMYNASD